jgi:DNA-binding transcriptional MocR family regulator
MYDTVSPPAYRYEALATFVVDMVRQGALRPGARAPSLRRISRQRGVSLSTALQAYRLLEDRGVLEARPQSGFFVAARGAALSLQTPSISRPPGRATRVAVSGVVHELLEHAADPALVPLGCAIPSPQVLAADRLDRCLARAARTRGRDYNAYGVPRGDLGLRQEIARRALGWGQVLEPENLAITCGCTEALALALKAVSRPGDTIAVESPAYFGVLRVIEALDLKALELPTDVASGVDLAALEAALGAGSITACLFASSFNNPLGCTTPEARKIAILDLLARHDVPLIEDDIYGDIYFGQARPRPFMALDQRGGVIYCSSFSKSLAPGYRIGWIAGARHMREILDAKVALTLCAPALPQAALADFLSSGGYDNHLRRLRRTFQDGLDRMSRTVEATFPTGTRVTRPAGGFVLWLELPEPVSTRALFHAALARGVCFAPGDVFSATDRYDHCLRLSAGAGWDERIEAGVTLLGRMATEAASDWGSR